MRFGVELAECNPDNVFVVDDVRISVVSDRIIRVEKGAFTDNRTQIVTCRNFANPQFTYTICGNKLLVKTSCRDFEIDLKTLRARVQFVNNADYVSASNRLNLGGTARTLDGTFGLLGSWKGRREKKDHFFIGHMRCGIFSKNGVSEIDDSASVILCEDGSVKPRQKCVDKYVLAFGSDYLGGLKEFYSLTGFTPTLPKYALGNWWSRYHAYTDKEYLALMDKFEQKDIPFTVATIDMDWHIVKNVPKDAEYKSFQGAGWTGYTFEKELFPDYKAFLQNLKSRRLAVTMNLHPRDGVRYFEEQYSDMARACGIDPASKKTIEFDLTDEKFRNAYFDILHHPYEKDGVDFWWIDWQQGTKSKMNGLDPLWLLNHYHTLDVRRNVGNGIILSRYAGLGSHRYPLGFSGDTFVLWSSLKFQPYFTALASNAGYSWWSHDIGGHLMGRGDNELYLRWLQFGVFSPVNRLHSNNMAMSKEPWNYPRVEKIAEDFLRLRHRLLPYLYSANIRTATEGVPLVCPAYYYTNDERAYDKKWRNQYYFGEQMFVCPVTKRGRDGNTRMRLWLPTGEWTHFFNGKKYEGGREYTLDCPFDEYPVFVKSGGIIPLLNAHGNDTEFKDITVRVYSGDGSYKLCDERGFIAFDARKTANGHELEIVPSDDCEVQKISIELVDCNKENVRVNGEEKSLCELKNLPIERMKIEF